MLSDVACCFVWVPIFVSHEGKDRVLRRIFGAERDDVIGAEETCVMRSSVACTPFRIL